MTALRNVLLLNAVSSGATGLGLILFPAPIATIFGVNGISAIVGVGIFLMVFAGMVGIVSRSKPIGEASVRFIVMLDVLWVIASIAVVALQMFGLSMVCYLAIAAVAGWVALMAYLQANGLKKPTLTN
jgi:hypothetical protein